MPRFDETVELKGLRELDAALMSLGPEVYKGCVREVIGAGTKPIVAAAREKVPRRTGLLKKSLGFKKKSYTKSQTVVAIIGARGGEKFTSEVDGKRHVPANIAHLVEFGHGGPYKADAHPFLGPAFHEKQHEAMAAIKDKLARVVRREAEKAGRRAAL